MLPPVQSWGAPESNRRGRGCKDAPDRPSGSSQSMKETQARACHAGLCPPSFEEGGRGWLPSQGGYEGAPKSSSPRTCAHRRARLAQGLAHAGTH